MLVVGCTPRPRGDLSGTYWTTVGTMSYMYVLWTVASAHKCEAPALWFDRQLRVDAWSLSDQCVCGAPGTFRVSVPEPFYSVTTTGKPSTRARQATTDVD